MTASLQQFNSVPIAPRHREAVHALFSHADFLYRSTTPRLLDAPAIDKVTPPGTQVIRHGEDVIGLWSVSNLLWSNWGAPLYSGFHLLHFRLSGLVPEDWWTPVYESILERLRFHNDLVRVEMHLPEFDRAGQDVVRRLGLHFEGAVRQMYRRDGRGGDLLVFGNSF